MNQGNGESLCEYKCDTDDDCQHPDGGSCQLNIVSKICTYVQSPSPPPSFTVAEVKPHYQCTDSEGQARVRDHVASLASQKTGLIALIQFEFTLPQPEGYTVFGASCTTEHADPAVVLVDENQFIVVSGLRDTVVGDYAGVPYLSSGVQPTSGSMCTADTEKYGERGYAGAVLRHTASGEEVCVIAGTLPHCYGSWQPSFKSAIEQGCGGRRLLIVADTNAACETEGPAASKSVSMSSIFQNHSIDLGECSDPAIEGSESPTCCHDTSQGHPEAQYWYDRTALCGGGSVEQFQVNADFVCGSDQEHKYTAAVVKLGDPKIEKESETIAV